MKRQLSISLIILILAISVFISIGPLVKYTLKVQLKKVFVGSTVTVGSCIINPLSLYRLTLSNIEIIRKPAYDLKVNDIQIEYSFVSLIKRSIPKVSFSGVVLCVSLPDNNPAELSSYCRLNSQRPAFLVHSLELSNLNLDVKLRGLTFNGEVSLGLDIENQLINHCRVKINSLRVNGAELKNISLEKTPALPECVVRADKLSYDKLKVTAILGYVAFKNNSLFIEPLSAVLLGGNLKGRISVILDKSPNYLIELEFRRLDLESFADEFNLTQKATISGKLDGVVSLKGAGMHIEILNGDFSALSPGGNFTIKDTRLLENMKRDSEQSMDLIVESLKNYEYNNGVMKFSLDKGNIVLNISLDGNAGKRNLDIILHDVLK